MSWSSREGRRSQHPTTPGGSSNRERTRVENKCCILSHAASESQESSMRSCGPVRGHVVGPALISTLEDGCRQCYPSLHHLKISAGAFRLVLCCCNRGSWGAELSQANIPKHLLLLLLLFSFVEQNTRQKILEESLGVAHSGICD